MRAGATLAVALALCSAPIAAAAQNIPSSAMPGRERSQFLDPFPKPERAAPVIKRAPQKPAKTTKPRRKR